MVTSVPVSHAANLWDLFKHTCESFAERDAYLVNGKWITYADLFERVCNLSTAFDELLGSNGGSVSPAPGQAVIATLLPNDHPLFELFFVAAATQSVLFPVNTRLSADEIERLLKSTHPVILVIDAQWRELLEHVHLPENLAAIVWVGGVHNVPHGHTLYSLAYEPIVAGGSHPAGKLYEATPIPHPDGVNVEIFCTSGTTGRPKLVPHSHSNVMQHLNMTLAALELGNDIECWGHFGPMYHVGDVAFIWAGVAIGSKHVFHPRPLRFEDLARVISNEKVTITKLVPTILRLLVQSDVISRLDFPSLKWILTGGDTPEPALVEKTSALFDCEFIQGYGMTEATCHVAFRNETRFGTNGGLTVIEGLEVRILDENGQAALSGEEGEIAIRGPSVFAGYLNNPGETSACFTADNFFRSGDLGYLSASGELFVSGRKKDMIIVGGENVFAHDIECVANSLAGVKSCAALGMADRTFGEVVSVAVVRNDPLLTEAVIIDRLRPQLASFKLPRSIHFFDELPLTPTGKIRKQEIRQEIERRNAESSAQRRPGAGDDVPVSVRVLAIMQETLGREFMDGCDPGCSLLDRDVDSLGMASLIVAFEQAFGIELPFWFILEHDSVASLIEFFEHSPGQCKELLTARAELRDIEAGSTGAKTEPGRVSIAEHRAKRKLATLLLQFAGLLLRPGLTIVSLLPSIWAGVWLVEHFGFGVAFILSPLLLFASSLLAMSYLLVAKWTILGRVKSGTHQAGSPYFYRWLMVHNLFQATTSFLGVYRGTLILNVFVRLCGARLGPGVTIKTLQITEPDLITIGAGTLVERKANLQPSLVANGELLLAPITVGSRSIIGFAASLGPNTSIADHSYVRPLSTAQTAGRMKATSQHVDGPGGFFSFVTYIAIGYLCALSLMLTYFVIESVLHSLGIALSSFRFGGPMSATALVLGLVALGRFGIVPLVYFVLVVLVKRLLLASLQPGVDYARQTAIRKYSHWVYGRLIDVAFFDWAIQLTNMSALTVIQYRLLGAKIGKRTFFTAPYTTEPELLNLADEAMIAGNVSLFPANHETGRVESISLEHKAAVANSCVLGGGTRIGRNSLLGDLSVTPAGFVLQDHAIAVGNPPRIVGRTDFQSSALSGVRFVMMQLLLLVLQMVFGLGATILSWVALTPVLALLAEGGPYWWEFPAIGPLLLLAPSMFTLAAIPVAKLLLVRHFTPGEYPLFGWMYVRWTLLETLLGRVEESTTSQFNGTEFARIFYESMGAKVGDSAYLMGSPIGGEFDLKSIGSGACLNCQSKIFSHSIKRRTLIFDATTVQSDATLRPFAIVEAGATVTAGQAVGDAIAFHVARGVSGRTPYEQHYLNLHEFQAAAQGRLPKAVFDYFSGGAADQYTLHRNEYIYSRYQIVPRVLRDVSDVSASRHFLGSEIRLPVMIAPMAMQKLAHAEGELGMARAASSQGIPLVLSSLSTCALEDVAAAGRGGELMALLQIYCLRNRQAVVDLIGRAERAGYRGLVLTVDAPVSGKREQDVRNHFATSSDIRFPNLEGVTQNGHFQLAGFDREVDSSLTWDIIDWIREQTKLPLFLKGILSSEDAVLAVEHGADGIFVSNHGGRQLDTTSTALEVLANIRLAVQSRQPAFPVYIDGGIRRGTDVFKAIALGADGVLLGRPCIYGLAVDGHRGVARVLNLLREEFLQTMRLAGCRSLADIQPEMVRCDGFLQRFESV